MVVKKKKYDVTVRYNDGGVDDFQAVDSAILKGDVLEILENTTTVYLTLRVITHIRIEEVE